MAVAIEPLTAGEFERVAAWLSEPEINRWLTGEWRDRAVDKLVLAIATRNKRNELFLVRSDGAPCGLVAFAEIDAADKTAMIWYVLGERAFAGRGVTSEAVRQAAALGFNERRFESVYAWIIEGNTASRRVLEKAGFREAGRLRRAAVIAGAQVDRIYFDLVRGDR